MKTLAVYPYTPEQCYLKDFTEFVVGYEKIILVPLSGERKRLKRNSTSWEIVDSWKTGCDLSETLLLLSGLYSLEKYNEIIDYGINKQIEIIVEKAVWKILDDTRKELVKPLFVMEEIEKVNSNQVLHDIETPVISIMGMGPNTSKFYAQLALKQYFEQEGYRTLVLGSSEMSSLFDIERLPSSMIKNISFTQKIYILNQYIWEKSKEYKPDIIIIGCPGGIMPYDRHISNGFGELPLIVSKAVPIDINLVFTYYVNQQILNTDYISSLKKFCTENFGTNNVFLGMTDIDMYYDDEHKTAEYMLLDEKKVQESIGLTYEDQIFNISKPETFKEIGTIIENILKVDFEVV
ncbi:MAG: TIGR04066 family peptide maturation system protein [Staphylococcus aureus]|jgi:peptide maturation system protein (TIGR04066 family)|nr:TIGR04066 family peptide maturation system protein [[Clostridium] nexile]